MTNGGDRHHDRGGKKRAGGGKTKPKDAKARLKRKNLLPKALVGGSGR